MRARLFALAFVLYASSGFAQPSDPPTFFERQIIVQGSVGQAGREIAFLNCFNPESVATRVNVIFQGGQSVFNVLYAFTIGHVDRVSLNLARDVPFMPPKANFSVDIVVETPTDGLPAAVTCAMTWYRANDLNEVETQTAVVRKSPFR